jgi:hypothetical protein
MARFVVGDDRSQSTLFPERLDDYLGEDNPVRAIDVFVDELDLAKLGFGGVEPEATGRPAYHPCALVLASIISFPKRSNPKSRIGPLQAGQTTSAVSQPATTGSPAISWPPSASSPLSSGGFYESGP